MLEVRVARNTQRKELKHETWQSGETQFVEMSISNLGIALGFLDCIQSFVHTARVDEATITEPCCVSTSISHVGASETQRLTT